MAGNLGGWTGLILLLVVILLFAAPKLPQLARSLGQSMTIFKKEIKGNGEGASTEQSADAAAAPKAEGTDSSTSK